MPVTVQHCRRWKEEGRPIVVLTAWDFAIAQLLDQAGVDILLVGDSLGMVALGYNTTLPVTLEEMLHHTAAVCRGVQRALVVTDLPFLSYQESPTQAVRSAGRILKETGAQAVKLEGGSPEIVATIAKLTSLGIPVMGHVGLTPQSVHQLGYKQQGKTPEAANRIIQEAIAVAQAGAFAIVLEHIPQDLAATITDKLNIPTIGIGAGHHCNGQVLVTADLLGLTEKQPPFAKRYENLRDKITQATTAFVEDVQQGKFPE
ncbi:3-methyl-2-oxobutanoate hydroxymethyltransferase [Spirulina sp. CS-785/01]|uniref:3-methyl-2-oxobutanoate hydroxymethyltransferase n=1 Tax=Spirulina sp. CS-785/01 TaxID=3021716 RepID=UPI00232CDE85|nr:3-methyl-2-oxobutanoate hydroxymethyltransferase [Spirulina sp. CS-785/01]MDB9314928.1 3-methyl-2-oxobutanoate hydroxymethyltransferase [Spirulina sp. CS-785/01]